MRKIDPKIIEEMFDDDMDAGKLEMYKMVTEANHHFKQNSSSEQTPVLRLPKSMMLSEEQIRSLEMMEASTYPCTPARETEAS